MGKVTKEGLQTLITAIVRKEISQLMPTIVEGIINNVMESQRKMLIENYTRKPSQVQPKTRPATVPSMSQSDLQASLRTKMGLAKKPSRMNSIGMDDFDTSVDMSVPGSMNESVSLNSGEDDDVDIPMPGQEISYKGSDDVFASESVVTTALSGNIRTPAEQRVANKAIRDYSGMMKRLSILK